MPKLVNLLSPKGLDVLGPGWHRDGNGLYLRVMPNGQKKWVLIFQDRGRRREMGFGSYPNVSLRTARQLTTDAQQKLAGGVDPIEERQNARRSTPTFGEFADAYFKDQRPNFKSEKHASQWRYSIEIDAKSLRKIPVDKVTTDDVLAVLKPIWTIKPETASRCRGRIERILDAAKARKFRTGENPAAWKGHLALVLPKRKKLLRGHLDAMTVESLGDFLVRLRARPGNAARALEFTILTAARTEETLGARWKEIDFDQGVWNVPADRMKAGRDHRVPLSQRALSLLTTLRAETAMLRGAKPDGEDHIFLWTARWVRFSNMAMAMLLRRMDVTKGCVHGFRSTFRDWAGEHTEFPRELIEMSLAHLVGNEVERAYRRGDALERRRKLMEAWADFCDLPSDVAALHLKAA